MRSLLYTSFPHVAIRRVAIRRVAVVAVAGLVLVPTPGWGAPTTTVVKASAKVPATAPKPATKPAQTKPAPPKTAPPKAGKGSDGAENAVTVIDIEMGTSKYSPSTIFVKAGKPIRFRFKNISTITHEALIGDATDQADHEKMMKEMGGMHMGDEPGLVSVPGGKTKTLDFTFAKPGRTMIGCHQPGHYNGGMKLNVVIESGVGIA